VTRVRRDRVSGMKNAYTKRFAPELESACQGCAEWSQTRHSLTMIAKHVIPRQLGDRDTP
jgi:hypothetical protein